MVWKNSGRNLAPVAITAAATAAATATISAAATAAATTAAVTAAAAAGRTFFAGTRFIHRQGPALKLLLVKLLDGCIGFRLGAHFDKGKTTRTSGGAVLHDVNCDNCARRCKIILQIIFGHTEGKVPDE